jgi:hypothetical protein
MMTATAATTAQWRDGTARVPLSTAARLARSALLYRASASGRVVDDGRMRLTRALSAASWDQAVAELAGLGLLLIDGDVLQLTVPDGES